MQPWCFSKPALESIGVSASCRRASRLWKTPKIWAALATPRKPWRPSANFLEKFWKSRICFRFSTVSKTKPHKRREETKTTQKLKEKTCLCWVHLSSDSLSLFFVLSLSSWRCSPETWYVYNSLLLFVLDPFVNMFKLPLLSIVIILMEHCVCVGQIMTIMAIVFIVALHQVDGRWFDECPSRSKAVCRVCRVKGDSWKSWMLWKCSTQCWAVDVVCDVLCRNGFVARHGMYK